MHNTYTAFASFTEKEQPAASVPVYYLWGVMNIIFPTGSRLGAYINQLATGIGINEW